jgi:hypothetical protein
MLTLFDRNVRLTEVKGLMIQYYFWCFSKTQKASGFTERIEQSCDF